MGIVHFSAIFILYMCEDLIFESGTGYDAVSVGFGYMTVWLSGWPACFGSLCMSLYGVFICSR